ncbi:MAG: glycosyltransferase [Xylophilus ampelinus]
MAPLPTPRPEKNRIDLDRNVSCLIVTYQDRRSYLRQVVRRIASLEPAVRDITIVFNGVPYDPKEFAREFIDGPALNLIVLAANTGSANGYAEALGAAQRDSGADFFWLLDDDNLPEHEALQHLEEAFALMEGNEACALLALREDRWEYRSVTQTGRHHRLEADAFFGFHAASTLRRKLCRAPHARASAGNAVPHPLVAIGHAPYGGFLMHRSWLDRIGVPKKEFFVYGDDHEYTDRIVQAGGTIYLCAASRIKDIEESWFQRSAGRCHYLVDPEASRLKAFFVLRNRVHLESCRYVKSRAVYRLNATVFALRVFASGYRYWLDRRFWKRLRLLAAAYREGRSAELRPMSDALKHWIDHHG